MAEKHTEQALQLADPDAPEPSESAAPHAKPKALRVMSRADYAVQVKEHTMAQPETQLVVRGDEVVAEFDTAEAAQAYAEDND